MGTGKDTISNDKKRKNYKIIISEVKVNRQHSNEIKRRLKKLFMELVKDKSI